VYLAQRLGYGSGDPGFKFREGQQIFYILQKKASKPPNPLLNGHRGYLAGYSGRNVKLTSSLHLAQRIRMSGVVSLLPLYALRVWTGTTVSVYIQNRKLMFNC